MTLVEHDLVQNGEEFSTDWCNKSKSWFSERKHSGRDFSVTAAIDCLSRVQLRAVTLQLSNRRMGGLLEAEIRGLNEVNAALRTFLSEQHRITEVALDEKPHHKLL
ncbi:DUF6626 family protein [Celeribacter sp.]|uniref:DUF6626 family protein n=1 Tax=Celeribacter sp. TaxID=1890673 RepID=UPI003A953DBC